jgi:hypothetical protein
MGNEAAVWMTSAGMSGDFNAAGANDVIEELRRSGVAVRGGEPRSGEHTGTRALMVAVLEDAIRCFLGTQGTAQAEAELWFGSSRRNWPFSFTVVCHTLGLDPGAVRVALQRMKSQGLSGRKAIGRSRPNVRRTGRLRPKTRGHE